MSLGVSAVVGSLVVLGLAKPPFFDTENRLRRGVTASDARPALYVPIHDGLCLIAQGANAAESPKPVLLSANEALSLAAGDTSASQLSRKEAADALADTGSICAFLGSIEPPVTDHATGSSPPGDSSSPDAAHDSPLAPGDYWLLDTSHLDEAPALEGSAGEWTPLRARAGPSVCDSLSNDEAALLATARGLAVWHRSVKFCSTCGSSTIESYRNGKGRRCVECGMRFRPRLDASVIVLVLDECGESCLLGRKSAWPAGRYSTLAGFVEFGETVEECVLREMEEEAGVAVERESIRFVASQPWLFPRSLMMGFTCKVSGNAADAPLTVDHDELEDAQWYTKDYVREQLQCEREAGLDGPAEAGGFHVPSKVSLARTLVEHWLDTP